ncbi:PDZ domain-containing protein [Nonomuraea sp. MG754425]|uniref:S1C family serine protease n=1 Tax=Nonomuraea sp. MG754425 TaxID=2570319 RepID=UPI001F2BB4C1|nr:trypsin-like peptidase domain-containing protein [Nonomuraea sp. MG754425]MCF6467484.1 PDZ domain-containing protein [Nonomuraea sp. MG754425]
MTDERPTEGRTPSDSPEPQGRPDFLPADDSEGRRPEPPASFGTTWGDPSGRSGAHGSQPYEPQPYGSSSYGSSGPSSTTPGTGQDLPAQTGPQYGAPTFGPPSFGSPDTGTGPSYSSGSGPSFGAPEGGTGPSYGSGSGPSFGAPDGGTGPSYVSAGPGSGPSFGGAGSSYGSAGSGSGPSFGPPDGGARSGEQPAFGPPDAGTRVYDSPSFGPPEPGARPQENGTRAYDSPFFGSPDGGARSYEGPPFGGGPSYGGPGADPPPPPPGQALGMGPGWAPPPPGSQGGTGVARRGPGLGVLVALGVVIALLASVLGSVGTYLLTQPDTSTDPSYSLGPLPTGATNRAPDSVAGVAARVLPSVVSLEVGNGTNTEGASGSGFLIKNGYVVTNNHVVAMAANGGEIRIMFNSRKTTTARIIGRDPGSDLAVVKPEETFNTPEITLGNSDQVVVGDPVIAIGSPLGLTGTVTTGIVSSLNRPVIAGDDTGTSSEEPAYISAIQTDAAINPGNSGGPLVNGRGEVVGVNSAIATLGRSMSSQSGSIGLGFAIPVNQTRRVAEELITTGKAKRPKIGIVLDKDYQGQGVRIASEPAGGQQPVTKGGPADLAGLRAGDVIMEIDGLTLQDGNELIALIRSKAPGAEIKIKYQRAGQERTATLTVVAENEPTPTPS